MLDPCTFVIFGSTGNLSCNKLLPALYHLEEAGRLPQQMSIVGFGRREWGSERWRDEVSRVVSERSRNPVQDEVLKRFCQRLHYFCGDLDDAEIYAELRNFLVDNPACLPNILFYLSIRPADYATVASSLAAVDLHREEQGWRRLVVEKPFGYDLESASVLDRQLRTNFDENQIYRIDHYLGKGTVQNVLVFRFANLMLEPLWNRNYIDHVQITHSEAKGIEGRAPYYDGAGALRDMIQSHLLQMLTLVAMEPPPDLSPESMRDEKVKVLRSIRPITRASVNAQSFRAQYRSGSVNGKPVAGYLNEKGVDPKSTTETYAALKLYIDNWRWRNVPFFLRTGKAMEKSNSLIAIRFKHPPQQLFRETQIERLEPNWILMNIQPSECLRMELQVKQEGLEMRTETTRLDAASCILTGTQIDAYEALLLDVIEGDQSLFLRYDEVNLCWQIVDQVLKSWAMERDYIPTYPAGSWGPDGSSRLFDREDQQWRNSINGDFSKDR
ncbi:MAG: glucose-6-phosphate dehydrogenase [Gammaproteobacteria bacterium]